MSKSSIGNARRVIKRRIFAKHRQLKMLWRERLAASKVRVVVIRAARHSRVKNMEIAKRFCIDNALKCRALKSKAAQYMLHGLFAAQKAHRGMLQEQEKVKSWTVCKDMKKQLYRTAMTAGLATGMVLSLGGGDALAMPQDGQIVAGNGTITVNGQTMNINQVTDKMIIDWQKFGISPSEWVNFMQPGVNSAALNRVIGVDASQIVGRLSSNGKVFLVNPSGIIFGAGAQVDVGGLVASTMNTSNENFLKSNYVFEGGSSYGRIENLGTLNAADKGYIALLAPEVINNGVIRANMGAVLLASGEKITLDFEGDGLLSYAVEPSTIKSVIENHNLIQADGGTVYLSAGAGSKIAASLVTNSGTIKADKIENRAGKVYLVSGGNVTNEATGTVSTKEGTVTMDAQAALLNAGSIDVSGNNGGTATLLGDTIDLSETSAINASGTTGGSKVFVGGDYQGTGTLKHASTLTVAEGANIAADAITSGDGGRVILWSDDTTKFSGKITARGGAVSGNGGLVEVSGKNKLKYDGLVDTQAANGATGNLLLDPSDFTIAASGGDITGAQLAANLATNNVTILSSQGTHGTNGDILVNDNITYDGTGNHNLKLSAYHDINFAASKRISYGGSGVLTLRVDNTGLGTSALADPSIMGKLVFGANSSVVLNDSAAAVVQYNPSKYAGTSNTPFTRITVGRYTAYMLVNDVGVASPTASDAGSTGLQAMSQNLAGNYVLGKDIDASATSGWNVTDGTAAGWTPVGIWSSLISSSFTGKLDGDGHVVDKLCVNRYDTSYVGLFGDVRGGRISNLGLTNGNITGRYAVGGLVGHLDNSGSIASSYNTGAVTGSYNVGGLVGALSSGNITSSYNSGAVTGRDSSFVVGGAYLGGLTGYCGGAIISSYNIGTVEDGRNGSYVGGLVGYLDRGSVRYSYNAGAVTGSVYSSVGGLTGYCGGAITITDSFWDKNTSGQTHAYSGNTLLDNYGKITADMKKESTFANWNFGTDKDWIISDGEVYPVLTWNAALLSGSTGTNATTTINQYVGGFESKVTGAAEKLINTITSGSDGSYSIYIQKGWNSLFTAGSDRALLLGDDHTRALSNYAGDFAANVLTADYNASLAALRNDYTSAQPLSVSGKNVTLNNLGLTIGANGTFGMDGNITATTGDINVNGNINAGTGSDNLKLSSYHDIIFAAGKTLAYIGSGALTLRVDNTGNGSSELADPSLGGKLTFAAGSGIVLNNTATAAVQYNPSKYKDTSNTPFDANITAGRYTAYMLVNDVGAESPTESGVGSTGLQATNQNLTGNYALGKDIDASATSGWNIVSGAATGWTPLGMSGDSATQFVGKFDGDGKVISGLYINRMDAGNQGLFTFVGADSVISNLGLTGVNIRALSTSGGLVGTNCGTITGSYVKGSVQTSGDNVGGLVGWNSGGNIINSYSRATVTGQSNVGGLVGGLSDGSQGTGSITNCYSTGSVTGKENTGGLIGVNNTTSGSVVTNSFWDTQTSGQSTSAGGTGLSTADMKRQASYTGWDFINTWRISASENDGYPVLQWQAPLGCYTISGILTGWNSGKVNLLYRGGAPVQVTTGADGSYSFTNLMSGSYLVYLCESASTVSTWGGYAKLLSDDATLNFSAGTLYADTSVSNMGTAIGSYTATQLPYTYSSTGGITLRSGVTFNTVGDFTLNGDVSSSADQTYGAGSVTATGVRTLATTNGAAITLNGALTADSALTINAAGTVAVNAALSTGANNLSITAGGAVTQTAAITAGGLLLGGSNASFDFSNAANDVAVLAGSAKNINYVDENALTIGIITSPGGSTVAGLTGADNITVETKTMDLTLGAGAPVTVNGATSKIVLAAGRNFINNNAADIGIITGSGRYFVYSSDPRNDTRGMTTYSKHYNQTYTAGAVPSYASSGNWFLYKVAPQITVAHDSKTITYSDAIPAFTVAFGGFIDGDTLATAGIAGSVAFSIGGDKSSSQNYIKGSHDVEYNSAASTLASTLGYTFTNDATSTQSSKLTVAAKGLTLSDVSVVGDAKVYDGTQTAALTGGSLAGVVSGDDVGFTAASAVGAYDSKNAGVAKTVTTSGYTLTGKATDTGNYILLQPDYVKADITKAALTITADDKTKNQNQANPIFTAQYAGLVASETPSVVANLQYFTTATQSSPAGSYAISPNSAMADNYAITYKDGVLMVLGSPTPLINQGSKEAKAYASAVETASRNSTTISGATAALLAQGNIEAVEEIGGSFNGNTTGISGNNMMLISDRSVAVNIKDLEGGVGTKIVQEGEKTFIIGDETNDANNGKAVDVQTTAADDKEANNQ